jgi:hypothetical protein
VIGYSSSVSNETREGPLTDVALSESLYVRQAHHVAHRHEKAAVIEFVTVHLAEGKSEAWITDRTGHTSSSMLYAYKRAARTHRERSLGSLAPLSLALPEMRPILEGRVRFGATTRATCLGTGDESNVDSSLVTASYVGSFVASKKLQRLDSNQRPGG